VVVSGEARRDYDPAARILSVSPALTDAQRTFQFATQIALLEYGDLLTELTGAATFTDEDARTLTRIGLANYFAGAFLLPYGVFRTAAEQTRYDLDALTARFGVSFETVCHRLSTLQRPRQRGVPFSFVRVDQAGNISKRQSATGFHFSRAGGSCPLWAVYEAFSTPGSLHTQIAEMPDGRRYLWAARTVRHRSHRHGTPDRLFSVGLGCELRHAHRLIYTDGLDLTRPATVPIGLGCKVCERTDCAQRAFPPTGGPLNVDPHRSSRTPYAARDVARDNREPPGEMRR
jgi:predicted transcriptional regulator